MHTQKNLLCIHKRSLVHAQHSCACSGPGNPGARDPKRQRVTFNSKCHFSKCRFFIQLPIELLIVLPIELPIVSPIALGGITSAILVPIGLPLGLPNVLPNVLPIGLPIGLPGRLRTDGRTDRLGLGS